MQSELWQQEARKLGGESLVHAIVEIHDGQKEIVERLDDMENEYKKLLSAFPGGDVEGHRRYHETMIQKLEETRRLRVAIQEKTISGLIWAGIVGLGSLVWHELTRGR